MSYKKVKSPEQQMFEQELKHSGKYRHSIHDEQHKRKPKNQKEWKQWTSVESLDLEQD